MSFLLKLHFDSSGCTTNSYVTKLGEASFDGASPIKDDTGVARSVLITPYKESGLKIQDPSLKSSFISSTKFTIYFKYKIEAKYVKDVRFIPIISYQDGVSKYTDLLYIHKSGYFCLNIDKTNTYYSSVLDYTFDGRWHTLAIVRDGNNVKFFSDGWKMDEANNPTVTLGNNYIGDTVYIGYSRKNNVPYNFNGGSFDDICIVDKAVYNKSFIPPTLYFTGSDTILNYYDKHDSSSLDRMEPPLQELIPRVREGTVHDINEMQKGWLPRRLRIEWYEERGFFQDTDWHFVYKKSNTRTIIKVHGLDINLTFKDRFYEGNAFRMYNSHKDFLCFMMFVNHSFVQLSKLNITKSDDWFTFFIKGRDPEINDPITSVEIVLLPFPVIYDEYAEEREDIRPLYSFDENGKFTNSTAVTYIYIDPTRNKGDHGGTKTTGSIEQNIAPPKDNPGGNKGGIPADSDSTKGVIKFLTSYVELSASNTSISGTSAIIKFPGQTIFTSGDNIILFKNTHNVHPEMYRVIGNNTIEYYNYSLDLEYDDILTAQRLSDNWLSLTDPLYKNLTKVRHVVITAEKDNQSVFNIPVVTDPDGIVYRNFLVFRGSVFMSDKDRYIINYDDWTITFRNIEDFVPKDTDVVFVFVATRLSDAYGPMQLQPIYLYTKIDAFSSSVVSNSSGVIKIPEYRKIKFSKDNTMMFVQDTFIDPSRYTISNNKVTMSDPNDKFPVGSNVIFVILRLSNEINNTNPGNSPGSTKQEEYAKGNRFVLYDIGSAYGIGRRAKLTLDNFVAFDQDGSYMPDLYGKIYNNNIIKEFYSSDRYNRVPRYITCVYREDSHPNTAISVLPNNVNFIRDYIMLQQEFYEMDPMFDEFISDFNIHYSKDDHYGVNLAKALDYYLGYNEDKLDPVFEKMSYITRKTYNVSQINNNLIPIASVTVSSFLLMPRLVGMRRVPSAITATTTGKYRLEMYPKYVDNYYRFYMLFFLNGKLIDTYSSISYSGDSTEPTTILLSDKLKPDDVFESITFHLQKNYICKLDNVADELPPNFDDLPGTVTVQHKDGKYLPGKVFVIQHGSEDLPGEVDIILKNKDKDLPGKINIQQADKEELPGEVTIKWKNGNQDLDGKLFILAKGEDDLDAEVDVISDDNEYLFLNPDGKRKRFPIGWRGLGRYKKDSLQVFNRKTGTFVPKSSIKEEPNGIFFSFSTAPDPGSYTDYAIFYDVREEDLAISTGKDQGTHTAPYPGEEYFLFPNWLETPGYSYGFWVGKYLASHDDAIAGDTYQGDSTKPVTKKDVSPWTDLPFVEMKTTASSKGSGFHIMHDAEWMNIALWCQVMDIWVDGNIYGYRDLTKADEAEVTDVTSFVADINGKTRTGMGPSTWNHNNRTGGIADMVGNVWEAIDGLKLDNNEFYVYQETAKPQEGGDVAVTTPAKGISTTPGGTVPNPNALPSTYKKAGIGLYWDKGIYQYIYDDHSNTSINAITKAYGIPYDSNDEDSLAYSIYPYTKHNSNDCKYNHRIVLHSDEEVDICYRGGACNRGRYSGLFALSLNLTDDISYWNYGFRLVKTLI